MTWSCDRMDRLRQHSLASLSVCRFEVQMQYGSIGWSVGATLGFALGAPERRMLSLIGDGSFQVTAQVCLSHCVLFLHSLVSLLLLLLLLLSPAPSWFLSFLFFFFLCHPSSRQRLGAPSLMGCGIQVTAQVCLSHCLCFLLLLVGGSFFDM